MLDLTWEVTWWQPYLPATWEEPACEQEICIEVTVAGLTFEHTELPPALAAHIEEQAIEWLQNKEY